MLFKILHGDASRISTDITPYHEGYCYVTYDGEFYVDMNNERVKLSAKDAETLTGKTLEEIKTSINYNDLVNKPTKISTFTNDAGYLTSYTETDPTVPSWAKASTKPTYTASEVGLGNVDNVKQYSASNPPPYPITKVNGKTGEVSLTASDVGADVSGTASSAVSAHNTSTSAHSDIREQISQLSSEIVDIKTYVTPQMFGAKADGVTDDTAAIQAAFDSLTDGGTIYFPSGKYIVQHAAAATGQDYIAVLIENKSGLTVILDNGATIKHNLTSANRYSLFSFYSCDGLEIRGGTIEGDRNEHPDVTTGYGSKGIHIRNCDNVYIHDIEVWNIFGDCIGISGTSDQCENVLIENCKLHDCYRNGLTVGGIKRGIVRGCHIYNVDGGAPEAGIDIEAEYGYNNEDITIEDCYIHDCTQATITFSSNGNGTKVRGCILDGSTMCVPTHTNVEIENTEITGMLSVKNNCILRNCTIKGFTSYGGTDFPNVDFKAYNTIFGGNAASYTFLVNGIQSIASYYFKDCEINHLENSSHSLFHMLNAGDTSITIEGGKINLWNTNLDTPFATGNFSSFKLKGCQVLAKSPTMKKTLLSVSASTVQMVDNVIDMSEVESYSPTCVATFGTVVNTLNCHENTFVLGKNIQWILNLSTFTGSAYLTQNSAPMASGFCLSNAGTVFEHGNTTSESVDLTPDDISDVVLDAGFITEIEAKGYVDGKITDINAEGVQQTPLFANSIEECTDTTKVYVLPDGYVYGYKLVTHAGGIPQFTNLLPLAIDSDGTPYNGGLGYKSGIKLLGTGLEESNNAYMSTGFIECKPNDIIRLKGFTKQKSGGNSVVPYNSSFGKYGNVGYPTWETDDFGVFTYTVNTPNNSGYVRFCVGTIAEDAIVTVNEEIKYSEPTTTYEWVNTGHLFIPTETGGIFTPSVSEDGVISWVNNRNLENPEPINIKGADGNGIDYIQDMGVIMEGYTTLDIYFTNGLTQRVNIPNGAKGDKGDNGDKGDMGATGKTGADGVGISSINEITNVSATETVLDIVLTNGLTTTVRIPNGADGKSAYEYAQESGYEGTEEEFTEDINPDNINNFIVTELAKRGQLKPEFAQTVEECTDTTKLYVLPDGYIYAYMSTEVKVGGYTNLINTADSEFKTKSRINDANSVASASNANAFVSNFITAQSGQIIRIKGVTSDTSSGTSPLFKILFCKEDNSSIIAVRLDNVGSGAYFVHELVEISEDGVYKYQLGALANGTTNSYATTLAKIRVSGVATNGVDNVIVTLDEEIIEPTVTRQYRWASTGHAFVPADYEDRIVDLEAEDAEIREEIAAAKAETDGAIADLQEQIDSGAASAKSGARWFALGDSITEGYASVVDSTATNGYRYFVAEASKRWVNIVAEKNGYELTNHGIGGTGYLQSDRNARALADTLDFTQCDFVTLAYGVNDWKYAVNIGSMDDDIETGGSMVANMRYVIKKILTVNPLCKIFVITPINCRSYGSYDTNWGVNYKGGTGGHLNGLGLQDIFDRMKEVCDYHGIEMIDMTHSSIVNRENIKTMLADYIHPTVECHAVMARELAKKINFM